MLWSTTARCSIPAPSASADSERRNALAYLGVDVVSVTRDQLMDSVRMDRVVRLLQKALGVDAALAPDVGSLRAGLRRELLMRP